MPMMKSQILKSVDFTKTQKSSISRTKHFFLKQEVGDDLHVCMMNILPKVSNLPSLLAINLMKMEI